MATRNSDIAALILGSKGLHDRVADARLTSGAMKALLAQYTMLSTEAQDDIIRVGRVRKGMLIPRNAITLRLNNKGGATVTITLSLGVTYDDSALTGGAAVISTGGAMTPSTNYAVRPTFTAADHGKAAYDCLGDGWLIATITNVNHGTTPAAGDQIDFWIPYLTVA